MKFGMKYGWSVRLITTLSLLVVVACLGCAFYFSGGSYFPAWITTLILSFALFAMLSIPRYVRLTDFAVEVHSLIEVTKVEYKDIKRCKVLSIYDMRFCIPIFGIPGVFGYYGYFLNVRHFKITKVYARKWSNFVLIEDKSGKWLIIGLVDRDKFIQDLETLSQ